MSEPTPVVYSESGSRTWYRPVTRHTYGSPLRVRRMFPRVPFLFSKLGGTLWTSFPLWSRFCPLGNSKDSTQDIGTDRVLHVSCYRTGFNTPGRQGSTELWYSPSVTDDFSEYSTSTLSLPFQLKLYPCDPRSRPGRWVHSTLGPV